MTLFRSQSDRIFRMNIMKLFSVLTLTSMVVGCGSTPRPYIPEKQVVKKQVVNDKFGYFEYKDETTFKCKFLSLDSSWWGNPASSAFRDKNEPVLVFDYFGSGSMLSIRLRDRLAGSAISLWSIRNPNRNLNTRGIFIPEFGSMTFHSMSERGKPSYYSNVNFAPDKFKAHVVHVTKFLNISTTIHTLELGEVDKSTFKGTLKSTVRTKDATYGDSEKVVSAEIECNIPENDWLKLRERFEKEYEEKL